MPCASSGISRSSGVTMSRQVDIGYGPNAASKTSSIRGTSPRSAPTRAASGAGCTTSIGTPEPVSPSRPEAYRPIWTLTRYAAVGTDSSKTCVVAPDRVLDLARPAGREHAVVLVAGDRDAIAGLVVDPVVAREPRGRARRLRGDDHPVVELLPPDGPPAGATRMRRAAVLDAQDERGARLHRHREGDLEPAIRPAHLRDPMAGHLHLRDGQPDEVERDRRRVDEGHDRDRGRAGEPVRRHPVVDPEGRTPRRGIGGRLRAACRDRPGARRSCGRRAVVAHGHRAPGADRVAAPPAADGHRPPRA